MQQIQEFTFYEIDKYELETVLRRADKYGKMIDAEEVIEGKEHLKDVHCGACRKIPLKLEIKECINCKVLICDKCYLREKTRMEDAFMSDQ